MKSEDIKIFNEFLVKLSEVFDNGREISESRAIIYFDILANYPIEKIKAAINALLKTRVYSGFPKPAEIIQMLGGTEEDRYQKQIIENNTILAQKRKEREEYFSQG